MENECSREINHYGTGAAPPKICERKEWNEVSFQRNAVNMSGFVLKIEVVKFHRFRATDSFIGSKTNQTQTIKAPWP